LGIGGTAPSFWAKDDFPAAGILRSILGDLVIDISGFGGGAVGGAAGGVA